MMGSRTYRLPSFYHCLSHLGPGSFIWVLFCPACTGKPLAEIPNTDGVELLAG